MASLPNRGTCPQDGRPAGHVAAKAKGGQKAPVYRSDRLGGTAGWDPQWSERPEVADGEFEGAVASVIEDRRRVT